MTTMTSDERRADPVEARRQIMEAARHLNKSRMAWVLNGITYGINWSGSSKGRMADSYATGDHRSAFDSPRPPTERDLARFLLRLRMMPAPDGRTGIRLEDADAVLEVVERHRAVVRKLQPKMDAYEAGTARTNFKVDGEYRHARREAGRLMDALREAGWKEQD